MLDIVFYVSACVCASGSLLLWALREPRVSYPRVEWDEDALT